MQWLGWLVALVVALVASWLVHAWRSSRARADALFYEKIDLENELDTLHAERVANPVLEAAPAPAPRAAPAPAPAARPAPPPPAATKVTYAADAFFDFDKSVLKPEGRAKLDDLVSKIKGINLEVIIAVGHTDSVGSAAYNQKLSVRRAESVKAYLVSKGIERNRIYTEGKGKTQPIASNKTAEGRAKNRRVEIEVVGTRAN